MLQPLNDFLNLGIDSTTDRETAQRIRFGNSMSILGISTAFVVLLYGFLANWPSFFILLASIGTATTFIPPILNSFKKTVAARISFLVLFSILLICFTWFTTYVFWKRNWSKQIRLACYRNSLLYVY